MSMCALKGKDAERLDYMIRVMRAYADGRRIECRPRRDPWFKQANLWLYCRNPTWNWEDNVYRVMEG